MFLNNTAATEINNNASAVSLCKFTCKLVNKTYTQTTKPLSCYIFVSIALIVKHECGKEE